MFKLNSVNYETEIEAAEAVDKYLSKFIEEFKNIEKEYQYIVDNAQIDPLEIELMESNFMKKIIGIMKNSYAKKIAKTEMKQQRILDKKDFNLLIKDVDKTIKLYPKVMGKINQDLEKFKSTNHAYEIELAKIMLEVTQKSIEDFEKQRSFNSTFLGIEQER